MNKAKFISALVAGLGLITVSGAAGAIEIQTGVPIPAATGCVDATNQLLSQDVTIQLSKGVSMGYICRLADAAANPPTVSRVGLGSCNIGGQAKARDVRCTVDSNGVFSPATCTQANVTAGESKPVTGVTAYFTTTAGGVIGSDGMATTACNAAGISGLTEAKYP
jgi:hypothetical protein